MTQEELQKLLDEFGQSKIALTPQWKIDRNDQLASITSLGGIKSMKQLGKQIRKKASNTKKSNKIKKYKDILNTIDKDVVRMNDIKIACEHYGCPNPKSQAWRMLKETSLLKQIHKGVNQHNPSLYKKIYK
jgi:hypothetical protein